MDFVATSIIFLASSLFGVYFLFAVIKFLHKVCWKPIYIQYSMRSQGVEGPSYGFLHGNTKEMIEMKKKSMSRPMEELSHDILPKIQPHTYSWINKYGRNYMFWYGPRAFFTTMETALIKEVMNNKSLSYPKVEAEGYAKKILGNGLATAEGEQWAKLRKLANHAFHADRLKNMTPAMIASVEMMLDRWKQYEGKEIEVFEEFKLMTSEVISRTAFSSSYVEGKDVFDKLSKLSLLLSKNAYKIKIPILSWIFKSRDEIEAEKLERGIKESIIGMITKREKEKVGGDQAEPFGNDYLGLLVKASHGEDDGYKLTVDDVVGDCKTFYLAGHETTTTLLSWAFLLLGIHTDWQEKARQEVLEIFGKHLPNTDGLSRMKTINMIINETLRLYPPVASLFRKVKGNVRLGKFNLSDNMVMSFPTLALHHDPQIWGDDVNKFKPDRFSEGIAKATNNNPAAFQPFGLGPRTCVGNNFATNEAKIALTMILQRYSFTLSPTYIHSPVPVVTIRPQHGLQGIKGPSYMFLHGNTKEMSKMGKDSTSNPMELSHYIYPHVMPHVYSWMKQYGKNFLCWLGPRPLLVLTEPEIIKEALNNKYGSFQKVKPEGYAKKLVEDGLGITQGEKWSKLRKLANHAFNSESLKEMVPAMIDSTEEMLERWRCREGKEIEVYEEFRILSSEIISRTAFGSSYLEGKRLFNMLAEMLLLIVRNKIKIRLPGAGKIFKTADDIKSDKIADEMRRSVIKIIEKREEKVKTGEAENFGTDFLGALIQASHDVDKSKKVSLEEMIDECKTFYIAGQETTNSLLAWTVFLLATHLDWQEKARSEVIKLFGEETPNFDSVPRLKIMSMIINETLRLYGPAVALTRTVERKTKLGKFIVPANTELLIPVLALHHDPDIWGQDSHLFRPERFGEGITKATKGNPMAFIPFGFGPRTCVGINFASIEAKITMSMILKNFKFTLSPNYVHSPIDIITVRPQHGVQIILQKL